MDGLSYRLLILSGDCGLSSVFTSPVNTALVKMAGLEVSSELPNLKIEIENSVPEAMETEDVSSIVDSNLNAEDIEEGEISDSKDTEMDNRILRPTFAVPNPLWVCLFTSFVVHTTTQ